MKRLTSILLALLMLVGMALAEEKSDAALGDWYALNTENEARSAMTAARELGARRRTANTG